MELVGFPAQPAFAVGNIYYIDNVNGGGVTCNNAGSGTSTTAPWCDISQATAHGAFSPATRSFSARGAPGPARP